MNKERLIDQITPVMSTDLLHRCMLYSLTRKHNHRQEPQRCTRTNLEPSIEGQDLRPRTKK